ncbi:short-chain dehydrogenase/reductase [Mycolicibacterium conceptionense]|jgi:NAD(P)-dependent dehydrogenase (short-subunit alcohol dehydrogenase family)|uniref:Oxidoreductase n=3 Tax=Mycolicibacterium TaxID=1866885 RepID=A0A0J8U2J9_9MYCO|nr:MULTISPECIES: SDR family NAD(P)-dependent oxidoreductase [Mycolicibacterium]KLI05267.1 oxidoreductase [Mycolicibacterium senegalense]KLO53114.1 oxidoreductase [Mycolicibacterium senegalense]KMV15726.1 oxidoreductase [Mycolicibacterium conceptionense]MCW1821304.1 SDR family NAD(P)-dependent oxidoreductase [Mycolicibacterium senegalense]OBB13137.1 short-chain dehydrogenase/reductase [Mycolicibacterium conceptionense]
MDIELSAKPAVFLVSGASRGLGRSIVEAALNAGHRVVAGVRSTAALSDLAAQEPDHLAVVELDVTDDDQVCAAVATAVERFGRLDVLVNNAGYANMAAIEDFDFDDFRAQLDANFLGVVRLTQAALPVMRTQRAGHIVQISSVGGRLVRAGLSAYQSAKWAVTGFSGVLAQEVAPLGIKVTVLEPGGMRTDWAGSSMQIAEVRAEYADTVGASIAHSTPENLGASDPAKVAELVLAIAEMPDPPGRLLVGPDAYHYATAAGRDLLAVDEKWEALSLSTAADDATAAQIDPLGAAK